MRALARAALLLATLGVSACATFYEPPPPPRPKPPVPTAEALFQQAQQESRDGDLAAAVETLSLAAQHYPDDSRIREELDQTSALWQLLRHSVSDRLLILEAETLEEEIPLLLRLQEIDTKDATIGVRIRHAQRTLQQLAKPLADCGQRHADARPGLAERCLALSLIIQEDPQVRKLHRQVRASLRPKAPRDAQPVSQQPRPVSASETERELKQVRGLMARGENFRALQLLDEMLLRDPSLLEAQELLFKVQAELDRYTDLLLDTGNSLYREGRIEAAMSSWRAVLDLDPDNQQARDNLSRAQRVLDNLERLRKAQNPAGSTVPDTTESSPPRTDGIRNISR